MDRFKIRTERGTKLTIERVGRVAAGQFSPKLAENIKLMLRVDRLTYRVTETGNGTFVIHVRGREILATHIADTGRNQFGIDSNPIS